jgi:hypothetical protein
MQIRVRLPAPEANFQNDQPVRMDFLPEVLAHNGQSMLPPFAKCIVIYSLFSRCLLQFSLGGSDSRRCSNQTPWLALAVEKRKQMFDRTLAGTTSFVDDAMMTFVHALASCAAIYVFQATAHSMAWATVDHENAASAYEEQALQAANELIQSVKMIPHSISHFKAHPFLPGLIHRAAVFLIGLPVSTHPTANGCGNRDDSLKILIEVLKGLQEINNSTRGIVSKLEKDALIVTNGGELAERRASQSQRADSGTNNIETTA